MAMTKCRECGNSVSAKAATCPSCGAALPKKTGVFAWIVAGSFAAIVASCISASMKSNDAAQARQSQLAAIEASKSPQQKEQEAKAKAKEVAETEFALNVAKAIRDGSKNPAAFDLVTAGVVSSGAVCVTYRGTNSFNAVVMERRAVLASKKHGDWNRDCAGREYRDVSAYVRMML